jgi:hypothetical protein
MKNNIIKFEAAFEANNTHPEQVVLETPTEIAPGSIIAFAHAIESSLLLFTEVMQKSTVTLEMLK